MIAIVIDDLGGDVAQTRRASSQLAQSASDRARFPALSAGDAPAWARMLAARACGARAAGAPADAGGRATAPIRDRWQADDRSLTARPRSCGGSDWVCCHTRVPALAGINSSHEGSRFTCANARRARAGDGAHLAHAPCVLPRTACAPRPPTPSVVIAARVRTASSARARDVFLDDVADRSPPSTQQNWRVLRG